MSWWEAVVLGVVQGITEFFPVSSSGHLVMTEEVLGVNNPGIIFEIAVHVATLLSVLLVYRATIWRLIRGCCGLEDVSTWPYVLKVVLATIPAVIVGFTLKDWFEARFDDPVFTGTMVLVTGSIVWSSRWARNPRRALPLDWLPIAVAAVIAFLAGTAVPFLAVLAVEAVIMAVARLTVHQGEWKQEPTWGGALIMGIAQSAAILPGISRSGSTVIAGMWRKIDPVAAAEFSFLMSIPAILGAAVLMVADLGEGGAAELPLVPVLIGALAAGVSGVLAIKMFVALLRKQNFHVFSYYCWAVGALFLLYMR